MIVLIYGLSAVGQSAGDYRSTGTGNWNVNGTWEYYNGTSWGAAARYPGEIAGTGTVTISDGDVVTLNVSPPNSIGALTFAAGNTSGSELTFSNRTLNVTGAVTYSAPLNNVDQIISVINGTLNCGSIIMCPTGSGSRVQRLLLNTGTITIAGDLTMTSNAQNRIDLGSGILNIGGNFNYSGGNFNAGTGTVNYNGAGNQTIAPVTYNNLYVSNSGIKSITSDLSIQGYFDINNTASVSLSANVNFTGPTMTVNSTVANAFTASSGTFTFGANVAQSVANVAGAGAITFFDVVAGTNATKTINRNVTIRNLAIDNGVTLALGNLTPTINITGNMTVDGTLDFDLGNPKIINLTGNLIDASGTINMTSAFAHQLNLGGANNAISTLNANSLSTINYNRAGDQQVFASNSYQNLVISGGGIKSLQGNSQVNQLVNLTNGVLSLGAFNLTVTNNSATAIQGGSGSTRMIETGGAGYLIRPANTPAPINFPVGSGGFYSPASLTITAGGTTGNISVRAVPDATSGPLYVSKYWDVKTSTAGKTITAVFTYNLSEITVTPTNIWYRPGVAPWLAPPNGTPSFGANSFTITGTTAITTTSTHWTASALQIYYSYQTGDWNTANTWTSDPSGTLQIGSTIPGTNAKVVILDGRIVSLTSDIASTGLDITIEAGGFLNMASQRFTSSLLGLRGQGTLQLATANFPTVAPVVNNTLVLTGGGTTEYNPGANLDLIPAGQTVYNHLKINSTAIVRQLCNLSLNGNLNVAKGTLQINDNTNTRRQLSVAGNLTVDAPGSITLGSGNTVTGGHTPTTTTPGGVAPFMNYYDQETHRVVVYGDFINKGSVRFTNQNWPVYNAFPNNGAATVYFMGSTNNIVSCEGQTDFYNIVVDKGTDQTFTLTVNSTAYPNFRLFGANIASYEGVIGANPVIRKALWIRDGSFVLSGNTIIPSLTEGNAGNADYFIPANGALVLDGPDVVVLATADNYSEVNSAYNLLVNPGTGLVAGVIIGTSGISINGRLQVNDGYLSSRESSGLVTWDYASGQLSLNGGTLDSKQFRAAGAVAGLTSYSQTGGSFILRGRFQRNTSAIGSVSDIINAPLLNVRDASPLNPGVGTFNLNNATNVYTVAGGTINIYDACGAGGRVFDVFSSAGNINVTGGTVNLLPVTGSVPAQDAATWLISSNSPFYNLTVDRQSSSTIVMPDAAYPAPRIINDLTLSGNANLNTNNLGITIGRNFSVGSLATYYSINNTVFNGTADQLFTVDGTIDNGAAGLRNLTINKTSGTLSLAGAKPSLSVQGTFDLTSGTFDDNGKTLFVAGNITNSGTHISTPGTGLIELNGTTAQSIGGNGSGIFNNLNLNNTDPVSPVTLSASVTVAGDLTFTSDKFFSIGTNNLIINAGADILNAGTGNRYIATAGNAGDGGLTRYYSDRNALLFPVGAPSTSHAGTPGYTPATLGFSGDPSSFGSITVIPVGYEHPATTVNNVSLTYYWRVKSTGFGGYASLVTHSFIYDNADVAGVEGTYVPAFFDRTASTWDKGSTAEINTGTNTISDWTNSHNVIDADFTAGDPSAFGAPKIYYSFQSGLWSDVNTWSLDSHTTRTTPVLAVPGVNDIVIIGGNDVVNLYNNPAYPLNTATVSCASLQIEAGSVLDIGNNPGSVFSMVQNHPSGNNGIFRLTTTKANPGVNSDISTFTFPSGDFSDFDVNKGTTECYTTTDDWNSLYILPAKDAFGNMVLSPLQHDNLALPNVPLVTVYGDLSLNGTTEFSATGLSWNTNDTDYGMSPLYTTVEKTIHVVGNLNVNGGTLLYYDDNQPQHLIVDHDVNVAAGNGANIWVMDASAGIIPNFGGAPVANTLAIGGNLNNNGGSYNGGTFNGVRLYVGTHYADLSFFGSSNAIVTGTGNNTYRKVAINKGATQATTLTINSSGSLNTPTDNWLNLQNGTLIYDRTGNLSINTVTDLIVPATAGLTINTPSNVYISNSASNNRTLFLDGRLTVINGNVYVGPANNTSNNADIEYSGGGNSAIDVQGGQLIVNGQVRRNLSSAAGVLSYNQANGTVVIYGNNANVTRAKLEVLNAGSSFNMTGGTLTIVRGAGTTFGDLYLRPTSGTVSGGSIVLTQAPAVGPAINAIQNYLIDAAIPLNNLTISGTATQTATAGLMVNPLELNGSFTLTNTRSIFNTNNINVSLKGNMVNNGTYNYGTNFTTFNGGIQSITGTTVTNFYDLMVSPVTSLTINSNFIINRNLSITSGNLVLDGFQAEVRGDLFNGGAFTDNNTTGGVKLAGALLQQISGTGSYGRLELNNSAGANLNNDITLQNNLVLANGVFDINIFLLTLNQGSIIEGGPFGVTKMIQSDGVISNWGIRKFFAAGYTGTWTFPSGVLGKYVPATYNITSSPTAGSVRVNPVNNTHISCIDPLNALKFYWQIESNGITGFDADLLLQYVAGDVVGTESQYVSAKLELPGNFWRKALAADDHVDEALHQINFHYLGDNSLNGEYTAGNYDAFPGEVPTYQSIGNGRWSDATKWLNIAPSPPCPAGGPFGANVIIDNDIIVDDFNGALALTTTINAGKKLSILSPTFGHNLGDVSGSGTLYLDRGNLPGGNYFDFLDCSGNGTVEYGGNTDYAIVATLFNSLPNVKFSGTGRRVLPNKDLSICKSLVIDGATLDNSVNNKKLTILGTMERYNSGVFTSGTGAAPAATVTFAGTAIQTIGGPAGDFTGTSKFNNVEINNPAGLDIGLNGTVEINNQLLLTSGTINTSATNKLILLLPNVILPASGTATSFINGPLIKEIVNGGTFLYPIGKGTTKGHDFTLTNTSGSTLQWTAEFFIPAPPPAAGDINAPLEAVNTKERWSIASPVNATAKVKIAWDLPSDLNPHVTLNGMADMRVAEFSGAKWNELASVTAGTDDAGTVATLNNVSVLAGTAKDYTSGSITTRKPRAAFTPGGPICGLLSGIPVTFSAFDPISPDFTINYSINNVAQPPVVFSSTLPPYILTTPAYGDYKLTGFTYYEGAVLKTGVVDPTIVTVGSPPTAANAGTDQSFCGLTGYTLAGNAPGAGESGLWTIISGTGGVFINNTLYNTNFTGTSGESYTLRWTITKGTCTSSDDVNISFPVVAAQPAGFTSFFDNVCQGGSGYVYTVPLVAGNTYIWTYAGGSGATFRAPVNTNSLTIDFDLTATSGTLQVQAQNGCGTSSARTLPITVNIAPSPSIVGDNMVCPNENGVPYATSASGNNFVWAVTGGLIATNTGNAITVNWGPVGVGTVRVTETNPITGCTTVSPLVNITITDATLPVITLPAGSLNLSCYDVASVNAWIATASVIDDCDATVTLNSNFVPPVDNCNRTVTVTFTALDNAGNTATATKDFTVNDNIDPVITVPVAALNLSCFDAAAVTAWASTASATDNCGGIIAVTPSYVPPADNCNKTVTVTFTASDGCGNTATATKDFTVNDNTAPVITGAIAPATVEGCAVTDAPAAVTTVAALEGMGVTITDACTADASLAVTSSDVSAGTCPVVITRTYTITDACGNSSTAVQTINVDDTTDPSASNPAPVNVILIPDIPAPDITVVTDEADNCSVAPVVAWVSDVNNGGTGCASNPYIVTRTYSITDQCGNSTTVTQTLTAAEIIVPSLTSSDADNTICTGASVTFTAGGGTSYDFRVDGTSVQSGASSTFTTTTLTDGQVVDVIVGSITGCKATSAGITMIVNPLLPVSVTIAPDANPVCTGANITFTATPVNGGTTPSYQWFNGVTPVGTDSPTFSYLPSAGDIVKVVLTSNEACQSGGPATSNTVTVSVSPAITVTNIQTNILCNGNTTGAIDISVAGGTTPYNYAWTGTGVTAGAEDQTNLAAGTYTVTVTDAANCVSAPVSITLTQPAPLTSSIVAQTNVTIYGGNDGSVEIAGAGGTSPYQYQLGSGAFQASGIFNTLAAGNYTITVQDANLCTTTIPVTITQPAALLSGNITSQSNVTCFGASTGSVTVTGTGGTMPYEYSLNGGTYQSSGTFTNLAAGTYTVTVRDAIPTTFDVPVSITSPASAVSLSVVNQSDVLCFGANTGSVTVSGSGGTGPYQYNVDAGAKQAPGTFALGAGTHTVTVTDANMCTSNINVVISGPAVALTGSITSQAGVTCFGAGNGTVTVAGSGGTTPYQYSINSGIFQASGTFSGLLPGSHNVTVRDANMCTVNVPVSITEPAVLSLDANHTDVLCPDNPEGTINLIFLGGTQPYNVIWSDGATTLNRVGITDGDYSAVVTDRNGCAAAIDVTVGVIGSEDCIEIPEIITPNGDGYNDTWRIKNIDLFPNAEVNVYTRWGKKVYESRNILAEPWDGTFRGKLLPTDSYHYILDLKNGSRPRSGVISIIK
ncbi:MAG TPA: gliding motility-associated C-terminal domain-containing protein [Bacteroidales bacterium]|nr:gliding motility-associated C-terminal domain-containing protein [Bacteroidales bacterium]